MNETDQAQDERRSMGETDQAQAERRPMSETHLIHNVKMYWKVWGMLLALTGVLLFLDQVETAPVLFVLVMVGAMFTKAGLITAYFMHMRSEHRFLQVMLLVGLLINGGFLFFLILPDAVRIFGMMHG